MVQVTSVTALDSSTYRCGRGDRAAEWGSGGRWFESSRPDIRKASRENNFRLAFFASWGLVTTPQAELRPEIRPFRTARYPSSTA
jgi:hypothetical protein